MREYLKFYIDGRWVDPVRPNAFDVENPATEQVSGQISLGSAADPSEIFPETCSVAGFSTSKAFGRNGSTHCPSM